MQAPVRQQHDRQQHDHQPQLTCRRSAPLYHVLLFFFLFLSQSLFPLPYHTWSFMAANTANVITSLNASSSAALAWMSYMYAGNGQYAFYNDALAGNTTNEVQALYAQTAAAVTGVSAAAVLAGLQDPNINENTRISWKTACSRSVTGTPTFFVNGLPVSPDGSLAGWTALLDPLFAPAAAAAKLPRKQLSGYIGRFEAIDRS